MGNSVKRDIASAKMQEQRRSALELRKRGLTYPQNAKAMGLALSNAPKAVQQAIADIPKELAEDVRLLELERLDRMLAGMWPKAVAGDPKAVAAAVKIMDRRAKYLGIDAPVRTELTGKDGGPIETKSGYDDLLTKLARIASDAAKVPEPADGAETGPTDGTPVEP
ncbi:MAG: hypothetical protein WBY94_13920 [Polyangiaceae bacterium]